MHVTIPMVTNSSELMDFVESVAAFQLLQSEKLHLTEVMRKRIVDELVLEMGLAGGMEFKHQHE